LIIVKAERIFGFFQMALWMKLGIYVTIISSSTYGSFARRETRIGGCHLTPVFQTSLLRRFTKTASVAWQPLAGTSKGNFFIMVNRNLLRQFDLSEDEVNAAFDEPDWLPEQEQEYAVNKMVTGRVLHILGDEVWIDVGY